MKKLLWLILTTTSTLVSATSASTYDSGVYFNMNAGFASIQNLPTGTVALSSNVGYKFNRGFALEAGWTGMPNEQWGWLSSYNIYDIAVKGTIPFNNMFSLYGRLGAAVAYSAWSGTSGSPAIYNSANSATSLVGLAGIGASFALSRHFDLRLEDYAYLPINQQVGGFGGVNVISGGFQFNF